MANKIIGVQDNSISSNKQLVKEGKTWVFNKTWEITYYVLAQDLSQTDDQILQTSGIPAAGTIYNGATCRGGQATEITRVRHPTSGVATALWEARLSFDSKIDPNDLENDPTNIRPKRRIYTEKVDELVEVDWEGTPIETSAGEFITAEFPFPDIIMEIERFENYPPNLLSIYNYIYHCNAEPFYGAPKGSAYMDDIQVDEVYQDNQLYLKTRYVIRFRIRDNGSYDPDCPDCDPMCTSDPDCGTNPFREDMMRLFNILNQGYYYKKTPTSKAELYMVNGQPTKVNLDIDGTKLPDSATPDDLTYLETVRTPYADFDALNLEY